MNASTAEFIKSPDCKHEHRQLIALALMAFPSDVEGLIARAEHMVLCGEAPQEFIEIIKGELPRKEGE